MVSALRLLVIVRGMYIRLLPILFIRLVVCLLLLLFLFVVGWFWSVRWCDVPVGAALRLFGLLGGGCSRGVSVWYKGTDTRVFYLLLFYILFRNG